MSEDVEGMAGSVEDPNTATFLEGSSVPDPYGSIDDEENVDVLEPSGEFDGVTSVKLTDAEQIGEGE